MAISRCELAKTSRFGLLFPEFTLEIGPSSRSEKQGGLLGSMGDDQISRPQPLLDGSVLRSDDGRAEETHIKESAKATEEAKPIGFFKILAPGSSAVDDSSLILDPGSAEAKASWLAALADPCVAYRLRVAASGGALPATTSADTAPAQSSYEAPDPAPAGAPSVHARRLSTAAGPCC